jgi:hypothetical protein
VLRLLLWSFAHAAKPSARTDTLEQSKFHGVRRLSEFGRTTKTRIFLRYGKGFLLLPQSSVRICAHIKRGL